MSPTRLGLRLLLPALVATVAAGAAWAYPGQKYEKEARVTLKQAREEALRAYPGRIISEELEKERGGSGLRYSFDVSGRHGVHEVGVDAKTGKILENSKEGPHPD